MKELNYSIIIPHYNSLEKLRRLINSIPANREDIEILIIDDNSIYFEEDYLIKKDVKNINIFKNLSDKKGAGVCRNIGLQNARGKWLVFADADDYFLENAFRIMDKYLKNEEEIIYFIPTSMYEDTKKEADRHIFFEKLIIDFLKNPTKDNEKELRFEFGVPWSKMIKRDLVVKNSIKFDETIIINDRMFSLKTGYVSRSILAVREKIYCVTRDSGSLTTLIDEKVYDIKIEVLLNINRFVIEINEKKNKPYMIGYLMSSREYGLIKFMKISILLLKNRCKIFPNNFVKDIFSGFIYKKILERKRDKKYRIKNEKL